MSQTEYHDKTEHFPHDEDCLHNHPGFGVRLQLQTDNNGDGDVWTCPECDVVAKEVAELEFEEVTQ